jgi:hypothetical protein
MNEISGISKILSANDVGLTGGHQAGILVPKRPEILSFFPALDASTKNPRQTLSFLDENGVTTWDLVFIYYNSRLFGGTRNEYRLTWMTRYFKAHDAQLGDEIRLSKDKYGGLHIQCRSTAVQEKSNDVIKLSGGWKVISMKGR